MTNKEAAERIKDIFGENPESCILETFIDENDVDAVKHAIKALETLDSIKFNVYAMNELLKEGGSNENS